MTGVYRCATSATPSSAAFARARRFHSESEHCPPLHRPCALKEFIRCALVLPAFLPVICACFYQVGVAGGGRLLAFRTVSSFRQRIVVRIRLSCIRFASFSDAIFCIAGHLWAMITDALLHLLIPRCLSAQKPILRGAWVGQGSHDNGDETAGCSAV